MRWTVIPRLAALMVALLTLACGSAAEPATEAPGAEQASQGAGSALAVMTGEVVWEGGGVELPEGAVLTVTLADTSIADAPWVVLSQQVLDDVTALPATFRLEYDPEQIDERMEYSLSASVELNGRLIYVNDTVHTVLTGSSPMQSDVTVIAVR